MKRICEMQTEDFDKLAKLEIEEIIKNQQRILHQAGVPGFFITSSPNSISLQTQILSILANLGK